MSKFINERAPEPTVGTGLKAKRRLVESEVLIEGPRVIDVSKRTFVPPPANVTIVRGQNHKLFEKARRILNP